MHAKATQKYNKKFTTTMIIIYTALTHLTLIIKWGVKFVPNEFTSHSSLCLFIPCTSRIKSVYKKTGIHIFFKGLARAFVFKCLNYLNKLHEMEYGMKVFFLWLIIAKTNKRELFVTFYSNDFSSLDNN